MIREIIRKEADEIVKNRMPVGQFYFEQAEKYVGIDNTTYDAQVEFFKTKEECIGWLIC